MFKPEINSPAPDFYLPDQNGKMISLSILEGKTTVLYFYPKDDTPGCTKQACELRDSYEEILKTGVKLYGVSPDSSTSHLKFIKKHNLPFDLLSDLDHHMADAYGVWVEKSMYGKTYFGVERTTFILSPEGIITHIFPKVKPADHLNTLLEALLTKAE